MSPYRLAVHLGFAVSLYSITLYHAFLLLRPNRIKVSATINEFLKYQKVRKLAIGTAHCFIFNLLTGVTVAGIDAGKVFNTWPTMNGAWIPGDYWNN